MVGWLDGCECELDTECERVGWRMGCGMQLGSKGQRMQTRWLQYIKTSIRWRDGCDERVHSNIFELQRALSHTAHLSSAGRIHNPIREQSLQNGGGDHAALRVTRDDDQIGRVKRRKEGRKLQIVGEMEGGRKREEREREREVQSESEHIEKRFLKNEKNRENKEQHTYIQTHTYTQTHLHPQTCVSTASCTRASTVPCPATAIDTISTSFASPPRSTLSFTLAFALALVEFALVTVFECEFTLVCVSALLLFE